MQLANISSNRHEVRSITRVTEYDVARPDLGLSVDECGGGRSCAPHHCRPDPLCMSSAKPKKSVSKYQIVVGLAVRSRCIGSIAK